VELDIWLSRKEINCTYVKNIHNKLLRQHESGYKEKYPGLWEAVSKSIGLTNRIIERDKGNNLLMKRLENYAIIPSASAIIKNFYYVTFENKLQIQKMCPRPFFLQLII